MRKAIRLFVAAALGSGIGLMSASLAPGADDARETNARESENKPPEFPAGFQLKDVGQLDNIRGELGNVTNKAVTKGDFGSLLSELTAQDKDRMKDYKDQDFKTLDGVIDQFRKDWQAKYGHDFDIKDPAQVYGDQFTIVQGVVTDPAVALANWPVQPSAKSEARTETDRARLAGADQNREDAANNAKLDKGREVAIVRIPASHGLPAINASMIKELPSHWRFDIPNNINSQEIHTQLQNHLTYLDQHKDMWPADENDAYRAVTHHVVASLYNVNAPQSGQ